MDLTETALKSERIYSGRVVGLRVDTVRLPNGKEGKREVVEHGGAVCVVPMRDAETVLLVRQWRHPVAEPLLEVPAGGLEEGEDPRECARRELAEEIGMVPDSPLVPLYEAYLAPGYSTEKMYAYLARGLRDAPEAPDDDEFVQVVPMPLSEALAACTDGRIVDAKSIAALALAARML